MRVKTKRHLSLGVSIRTLEMRNLELEIMDKEVKYMYRYM